MENIKPQDQVIDLDEIMRQYDAEARYRVLKGWQNMLIFAVAAAMSLFHLYTAGFGQLLAMKQRAVHLAFVLFLTYLLYPATKKSSIDKIPWYDFVLAVIAAYTSLYLVIHFDEMITRSGLPTPMDVFIGFLGIAMLLEATRRVSNPVLPILAIVSLIYCYHGRYFPSLFAHRGFNTARVINHMYLGTEGVFGVPISVSATFVFMFILFGSILQETGMGKFVIDLALAIAGRSTGGPAKVAVISSGIMGTVSGSSVANVCTTGTFTIPLMKSIGYKPYFAGAVEAVASTGGQIMPPVMGAAAFIMAEFLGVPYIKVALAAVIPALLYYTAVMVQVHFEATRLGLLGLPKERLPRLWSLLRSKGHLLIPLFAIIYFLVGGYTPMKAAYYGVLTTIAVSFISKDTRLTLPKMMDGLVNGAKGSLGVACACGTVGIIVGMATLTGLGLRIASLIITISRGNLLITMLLTMVTCILLGAGLPTTANFIVTSTIAAPALLQLGVAPMAAYMFVLYFGIAADLSPPVALAAYAGAGIAGADPMKTGITAVKLALAGFLVPFIYVMNPMLVLVDVTPLPFILAIITAVIGVFLLGMSTIGYYKAPIPFWLRIIIFGGALALLIPGLFSDAIGIAILAFTYFFQKRRAKGQ
ncbi:TRAP transporter permease [Acetomicrobium sp.]|uniref:TRAP transporter permease n=1 Tax=Acetomicrobium sp. TaxID=1872099 RepID=UPI002B260345|nr:TRAP transporter permease [Acetomicrobium sp.]